MFTYIFIATALAVALGLLIFALLRISSRKAVGSAMKAQALVPVENPMREDSLPVRISFESRVATPVPADDPRRRYDKIWEIGQLLMPPGVTCLMEVIDEPGASTLRSDYEHACGFRLIETRTIGPDGVTHRVSLMTGGPYGRSHEAEFRVDDGVGTGVIEGQMAQLRGLAGAICQRNGEHEWSWRPFSNPRTRVCA